MVTTMVTTMVMVTMVTTAVMETMVTTPVMEITVLTTVLIMDIITVTTTVIAEDVHLGSEVLTRMEIKTQYKTKCFFLCRYLWIIKIDKIFVKKKFLK